VTRYFINCSAPSSDEAHDAAARHGRVIAVRIHLGNQPGKREWVYGLAEIELTEKIGENDAD
jgi:hypothetical protein